MLRLINPNAVLFTGLLNGYIYSVLSDIIQQQCVHKHKKKEKRKEPPTSERNVKYIFLFFNKLVQITKATICFSFI